MTESSTLTVMFTDMVASTELFTAEGEQTGEVVRRSLFGILRGAMEVSGGTEVKNLGDGLMMTFPTVRSGLEAAVLMQRRAARHNRQESDAIHLRIGMSVGDAVREDGDWFGVSVIEAARLCAVADGDQVLVSEKVELLADPGGPPLSSVGEMALKGLPVPTSVYEVEWERPSPDERGRLLPRRLDIARTSHFVGRDRELKLLADAISRADTEALQLAFICGEAGIGKTTLAAEAAAVAREHGARVVYGRNHEDFGTPFQALAEALGDLVEQLPAPTVERHVAAHGGRLQRLVPGIAQRAGAVPRPPGGDPESERYRLYAGVIDLLQRATEDWPLVVIVDDLHWADDPTLDILGFALPRLSGAALAFVGTYRDTDMPGRLRELVADLHRDQRVTHLELHGFHDGDVMQLIELRSQHDLDGDHEALARAVRQESGGNPFFVGELLRSVEEGSQPVDLDRSTLAPESALPASVREVILMRVQRLGERTTGALELASVVGREFEFELLSRALDADPDELAGQLDAAVRASLLRELPDCAGTFVFPHALVPYALYHDLGPSQRRRAHARVAEALEALCGDNPGPHVVELARHWSETTASEDLRKAVRYSMASGELALEQLAPGEAVHWYQKALDLHDRRFDANPETRCEIQICLGKAQALAGMPDHKDSLLAAFEAAHARGDRPRAVRAALANGRGVYSTPGEVDADRVSVLRRAIEDVGAEDSVERAELLARLADELVFADAPADVQALSAEALEIVRRLGDSRALIDVVAERAIAVWSPDTLASRREEAEEAVQASWRIGDSLARFHAYRCRVYASLCAGEVDRAARDHAEANALAERTAHPMARWMARVMESTIHAIRGDFEQAEQLATEAFEIATSSGQPDALFVYSGQLAQIRFEQGRLPELEPMITESAKQFPYMPALTALLAATAAEAGHEEEARAALAKGAEVNFAPLDITWGAGIGPHAIACARVGDETTSKLLRPMLEPYAGQVAYTAANAWLTVDHHLGAIARVDRRWDAADEHLRSAAEMAQHMGAPAWLARAQVEQARVGLARGCAPADVSPLLERAHDAAARHGAQSVEREAAALQHESKGAVTL